MDQALGFAKHLPKILDVATGLTGGVPIFTPLTQTIGNVLYAHPNDPTRWEDDKRPFWQRLLPLAEIASTFSP